MKRYPDEVTEYISAHVEGTLLTAPWEILSGSVSAWE